MTKEGTVHVKYMQSNKMNIRPIQHKVFYKIYSDVG